MELDHLRDLYGGPPNAFVAARDALAKELRAAGDREGAKVVKQLRRHSAAEWVLNRVAHANPDAASSFADAAAQLRGAQAAAIEGRQGGDVREAMSVLRARTAELVAAATELDPSVAAGDVAARLQELAGDEHASSQLVEGVLGSTALGEADPFAGLTPAERTPRATATTSTGTVAERSRAVRAAAPAAKRTATDAAPARPPAAAAKAAARQAREEAARRRAELREAEQAARRAARDERDARVRVDEAERALADARAGLAEAVAERTAADEEVQRLGT